MTAPRMPIEEARRLWREQKHTMPVTDPPVDNPADTPIDPVTGEPLGDITRDYPVIYTPEFLGYTIDELDPDDEGD